MLNKILVAIDQSASSEWTFDTALEMAKSINAELLLVHVLDSASPDSPKPPCVLVGSLSVDGESSAQKKYEQQLEQFEDRYDAFLKQKQANAEAAGVTTTYLQTKGLLPAQKICEIAKTSDTDLIVVGNRDRTNPSSISNYLTHHAPCSVTVVHPKAHDEAAAIASLSEAVAA